MTSFGTAGWSYEDWDGTVYPAQKPKKFNSLEFIANYLDAVEINSSFYRPPSPNTVKNWVRATSKKDFLFTVKLWEQFTHKEAYSEYDIKTFKKGIEPLLGLGKLGALLVQFPWSFDFSKENLKKLLKISEEFKECNPCVELRNMTWKNDDVIKALNENQIGFVNIDQPRSKNSLLGTDIVTSDTGYLRLHGRNIENWFKRDAGRDAKYDYLYNDAELDELAALAKKISEKSKEMFVITNNHFRGSAFKNALQLKFIMTKKKILIPRSALQKFPDLEKIASKIDDSYSPVQGELWK